MKYKINSDYVLREAVGECMIVPIKGTDENSSGFIALNETGRIIMNAVEQGKDNSEIVEMILSEYETTPETAKKDVAEFIEHFKSAGIIE